MRCTNCGFENPEGMSFCGKCASPLVNTCTNCGFENPQGFDFCGKCSAPLTEKSPSPGSYRKIKEKEESSETTTKIDSPQAERRQLTVMFCDLVGSTSLSEKLDPEELRELIQNYLEVCAEVISRYDGYIAKYLGDGILVYFGYPMAHEDDAQRAVHTGLEILYDMDRLNSRLKKEQGRSLSIRIGVHTGLVVAGEMGGGDAREPMAIVGETPNIAARLEGVAEPDTMAISPATYQLIDGYFECKSMGLHTLKGISQPLEVYSVLKPIDTTSRLEAVMAKGMTSLIGREDEVQLLFDSWEHIKTGIGQLILLSGEAGIGKSRLVNVFKDHVASDEHTWIVIRCSPYYQNSFLHTITDYFQRRLDLRNEELPEDKIHKIENFLEEYEFPLNQSMHLLASLLSISLPEKYKPQDITPQKQKELTLDFLVNWIIKEKEKEKVILVIEDLHWIDPSTLEFINLLVKQGPNLGILSFYTFRPDFDPPWKNLSNFTQITLKRLPEQQVKLIAKSVAKNKTLPDEVIQQIVKKTDGIPLFVEELTKMILDSGLLIEKSDQYELRGPLPPLAIPTTLQDSLMSRLDRLASVREVAQLSAIIGREFSYELLSAVSLLDGNTLKSALFKLVDYEILYEEGTPPSSNYIFKHALIRDAAYGSLLKRKRREYHQRVAEVYESKYKSDLREYYPMLVHHWDLAAGDDKDYGEAVIKTVNYLELSGEMALRNGAFKEAGEFLQRANDLYELFPDSDRTLEHELNILKNLGIAVFATTGFGAKKTMQIYERAWKLCEQLGETPGTFPILWGLWLCYHFSSDPDKEFELGSKLIDIAQKENDDELLLQAHHAIWTSQMLIPNYSKALIHLEEGRKLYNPDYHENHCFNYGGHDPGMCCHRALCLINWFVGYPDKAVKEGAESIKHAKSHQFSLITAQMANTFVYKQRGEIEKTQNNTALIVESALRSGLPGYLLWTSIFEGWVMGQGDKISEGIALIEESCDKIGYKDPGYMSMLAELYLKAGRTEEGLQLVKELLEIVDSKNKRDYEPELFRLKGELLMNTSHEDTEKCFKKAIEISQKQGAKSLELRAVISLCRLKQKQDKTEEAKQMLSEIYGWFTEGFETADLKDAKLLLKKFG